MEFVRKCWHYDVTYLKLILWKLCHVRCSCMKICSWWLMQSAKIHTSDTLNQINQQLCTLILQDLGASSPNELNTSYLYIWVNTCPLKTTVRIYAYVQTQYLHKCWHFHHPQPSILACSTEVHFRVTDLQQRGIYEMEHPTTWTTKMVHWKPFPNI